VDRVTLNRWALLALAGCAAVSAAGFAYIGLVNWVEEEVRKIAEAKWD
jgi:hypothetical protein